MIWTICLILSMAVSIGSLVYAIHSVVSHRRTRLLTPFQMIFGGLFLAVFLGILPIFWTSLSEYQGFDLRLLLYTASVAFQVFTVNAGADFLLEHIGEAPSMLIGIYSIYMAILFVIVPIMTFSFVVSLFRNAMSGLRYLMHFWGNVYAFSEVNEKTILLAGSIREKHPKDLILFANVDETISESDHGQSLKDLNCLVFPTDITSIPLKNHSAKAKLQLIVAGEESDNLLIALKLINLYRNRDNTDLYVFSTDAEGEFLLANAKKGNMKVRRVNEMRSLVYHFLYDNGYSLFQEAKEHAESGSKVITALLIGLGQYGLEMARALSWFCQMDGYQLHMHIFDSNEQAFEQFSVLCPELLSEADYKGMIKLHPGIDAKSTAFVEELAKIQDITFAFVALGDDSANIDYSLYLRMLLERNHVSPLIRTIVYNVDKNAALENLHNYRGQNFKIESLGDMADQYSEKILLGTDLEKLALERHLKWGEESEFWTYEYNYRSSMAAAIHSKERSLCNIDPDQIAALEHRRWSAYMRSEGYIYSGSQDKSSRSDLGKMHHDLVAFEALTEEDKKKNS